MRLQSVPGLIELLLYIITSEDMFYISFYMDKQQLTVLFYKDIFDKSKLD